MASAARGGGAAHLLDLLPALRQTGWDCEAAVGHDGPLGTELTALGFPVHYVNLMERRLAPLRALRLARLTDRLAPDIVHLHGTRAAFMHAVGRTILAAVSRRAREHSPVIYTAHGLAYRKDAGLLGSQVSLLAERVACYDTQAVISVSRTDLADLARRGYLDPGHGFHISNPVCTPAENSAGRSGARLRLGLPSEAVVIGTVARLVPQKAVGDLIEAVARIALALEGSSAIPILVVVGDGPMRADIERRARTGAGGARVLLLGERGDVPQILPAFDVFALSSHWEGEPIALLEAMAAGLPCVATATEGAREILGDDSSSGHLVPVGDVDRFADALASLLRDAGARKALGAAARDRVRGRTPEAQAARLADVYRQILGFEASYLGRPR